MQRYALHIGLHNDCILMKAPIYKGSEGFTYNNTIKKVKLYKKIKVKIIIKTLFCCVLFTLVGCVGGGRPMGAPTVMVFVGLTEGSFCILHFAFCILH